MNKKLLTQSLWIIFLLFVVHTVLTWFAIYWIYPWTDNAVHIIAGFAVGLWPIAFYDPTVLGEWSKRGFLRRLSMVLFVAIVGIVWEFTERRLGLSRPFVTSLLDAQMDVMATIFGSFFSYLYVRR